MKIKCVFLGMCIFLSAMPVVMGQGTSVNQESSSNVSESVEGENDYTALNILNLAKQGQLPYCPFVLGTPEQEVSSSTWTPELKMRDCFIQEKDIFKVNGHNIDIIYGQDKTISEMKVSHPFSFSIQDIESVLDKANSCFEREDSHGKYFEVYYNLGVIDGYDVNLTFQERNNKVFRVTVSRGKDYKPHNQDSGELVAPNDDYICELGRLYNQRKTIKCSFTLGTKEEEILKEWPEAEVKEFRNKTYRGDYLKKLSYPNKVTLNIKKGILSSIAVKDVSSVDETEIIKLFGEPYKKIDQSENRFRLDYKQNETVIQFYFTYGKLNKIKLLDHSCYPDGRLHWRLHY